LKHAGIGVTTATFVGGDSGVGAKRFRILQSTQEPLERDKSSALGQLPGQP